MSTFLNGAQTSPATRLDLAQETDEVTQQCSLEFQLRWPWHHINVTSKATDKNFTTWLLQTMTYADIHRFSQTISDKFNARVVQYGIPPTIHFQYRLLVPVGPEYLVLSTKHNKTINLKTWEQGHTMKLARVRCNRDEIKYLTGRATDMEPAGSAGGGNV